MSENTKVKRDILFYYWTGILLYITNTILYVIHLYQWKGRAYTEFAFMLLLFSLNITLIVKIKEFANWARKMFMFKTVIFVLALYPIFIFADSGGWVYSSHWPHGVFQRVSNMLNVIFEVYLFMYLKRRIIRYAFVHKEDIS